MGLWEEGGGVAHSQHIAVLYLWSGDSCIRRVSNGEGAEMKGGPKYERILARQKRKKHDTVAFHIVAESDLDFYALR